MRILVVLSLVAVATCLPSQDGALSGQGRVRLAPEDYEFLKNLPRKRIGTNIPGFKYVFVDEAGRISTNRGALGTQVEVAGSPRTTDQAIRAAAGIIAKMTRYMPPTIFRNLASKAGVGVFSAAEKLTVFPEYANLANGNCGASCTGNCAHTCTFDGRKWEDIAGIGGQRGVVLDDNILCTPRDPYRSQDNILSHEFTHTIHLNALPSAEVNQITAAYNNAKARSIWTLSSYAMSNDKEYFAEGGSSFFGVSISRSSPGGMNLCGGNLCGSEQNNRNHIHAADINLFNALSHVYTNNRPQLLSGLTICPSGTVVG